MLLQIFIGMALVGITVFIQVVFIQLAFNRIKGHPPEHLQGGGIMAPVLLMTAATMWLFLALCIAVSIWALAFLVLGIFATFSQAMYFSAIAFTTLGFGDVLLPQNWQLLSGFSAANGLLLFGLNTGFLIESIRKICE